MDLWVGTSGFSYKEWVGGLYPAGIRPAEMLRYYGERLTAVEIDNTFYRLPKRSVLEGWAVEVPDPFRFTLKASRRITHFKRLKGTEDETSYLVQTAAALEGKLGAILFQLPPNLPKDRERLERFLDLLPGVRAVLEFRHASWFDEEIFTLLRSREIPLCIVDWEEEPVIPFVATAPFGYLRLRRPGYDEADLDAWFKQVTDQSWNEAFVFKHEDAGIGPDLAARFIGRAAAGRAGIGDPGARARA